MANAAILIGGTVIQTTNLSNLKFNLDGFLVEFTMTSDQKTIIHVNIDDFRATDIQNSSNGASGGYYPKADFLNYLAKKTSLKALSQFVPSNNVPLAASTDSVFVERLSIVYPYTRFYNVETYSFAKQSPPLDNQFNIIIPSGTEPVIRQANDQSAEAAQFYANRISLASNFQGGEQVLATKMITEIAIKISAINRDIFSILNGPGNFSSYILRQNTEWISGNILNNPSIDDLNNFYNDLNGYYKITYANQILLLEAIDDEKLYWLALGLSIGSLSVLTVTDKIQLLTYLAKNKLSEVTERVTQEELVIKILLSFNSVNISDISPFLELLLQKPDSNSDKTLYETLYKKMSTSTNFKTGLIGLSNWVLNTQFQPTKTKDHFVRAVYLLWQFSKYNPYNDDGSIKPHTISFKSSDTTLVDFSPNPTDLAAIFTYTHYVAYTPVTGPPYYIVNVNHTDAAPMVMPYESEKDLGIFFDNFLFGIQGNKIVATRKLPVPVTNAQSDAIFTDKLFKYGTYDIFQPVSLLSDNVESISAITTVKGNSISENGTNVNSFIPIFVLEYIHSADDRNNAETIIGYVLDVASLFDGVAALSSFRYLRWAGLGAEAGTTVGIFTAEGLKIVVGGGNFLQELWGFWQTL